MTSLPVQDLLSHHPPAAVLWALRHMTTESIRALQAPPRWAWSACGGGRGQGGMGQSGGRVSERAGSEAVESEKNQWKGMDYEGGGANEGAWPLWVGGAKMS